jgi:phosphatidylglycerophosphate synthase
VLLAVPFLLCVQESGGVLGWTAAVLFCLIAASDVVDGRVARRLGTTSARGRVFDHGADIGFVLAALGAYAWRGAITWLAPIGVAISFVAYAIESARGSSKPQVAAPSIANRLGHLGGISNYVVVGVLVGNETVGLQLLPPAIIQLLGAAVVAYSGAAIVARFARAPIPLTHTGTARRAEGRPRAAGLE